MTFDYFVRQCWDSTERVTEVLTKQVDHLSDRNKNVFGNLFHNKRHLCRRLGGIQKRIKEGGPHHLLKLEKNLQHQLDEVLDQIELYWFQKSRMEYIRDGDRNTRFFHLSTVVRRRTNRIKGLLNSARVWVTDPDDLQALVTKYYKKLFTEDDDVTPVPNIREHRFSTLTE